MDASAAPDAAATRERGAALDVGDMLPDVVLHDQSGAPMRLLDVAADATVIIYFYPLDGSRGCTTQACAIRDSWPLLRSEGVEVLGINAGSTESHERFKARYGLPFPLLSDPDHQLARAFGFIHRLPGLTTRSWSRIERSTVIADPGGRIRAVLRRVKPTAHWDLLRVQLALPDRDPDRDATTGDTMPAEPAAEPEPEPDPEPEAAPEAGSDQD